MTQEKNSFDDVTKQEKKNIIKIGNILTIGGSGSGKRNALFNSIIHQPDIDKIYLYAKYPYEGKYLTLVNKRESARLKHLNDSKTFIEYSNDIDDIYKNTEACNPNKKRQILVVFEDVIDDMLSNKKLNPVATKLVIRGRKLNISLVFITQSYSPVTKNIRLNSRHDFIMKIPNKRELQHIAFNHSSDIDFLKLYKKINPKSCSHLVIDTSYFCIK